MSSKYSEKNAVQIKKDIKRASVEIENAQKELVKVNQDIDQALKELEEIRRQNAQERKNHGMKVANIWLQAGKDLKVIQRTKSVLSEDIQSLTISKNLLNLQVETLRGVLSDTIQRINDEKNGLTFIPGLIEEIKKKLVHLANKKTEDETAIESMQNEKTSLEISLENLKKFELDYKKKIADLEAVVIENTSRVSDLLRQVDSLEEIITTIEKREHDSEVMAFRLTEEYRKVYFGRKLK